MNQTCETCEHWHQDADYHRPQCDGPLGSCGAIPSTTGDRSSVPADALAVTQDAEEYDSVLYTRPGFGCVLHVLRAEGDRAAASLEADAQALADVRTLDEWAGANTQHRAVELAQRQVSLFCGDTDTGDQYRRFNGPTPDAARAAAAVWVREQGQ